MEINMYYVFALAAAVGFFAAPEATISPEIVHKCVVCVLCVLSFQFFELKNELATASNDIKVAIEQASADLLNVGKEAVEVLP